MHIIPNTNKVFVSRRDVETFNLGWPCSTLRDTRAYWFEFDRNSFDLIDTDCPEHDDGSAALAMSQDCYEFLFNDVVPVWATVESQP